MNRLQHILAILLKNGFEDLVSVIKGGKDENTSLSQKKALNGTPAQSERIRSTIEALGPTFIKFAQILSTRPDLISMELIKEFEKLQDKVLPMEFEAIDKVFVEEFGKSANELFIEEPALLASASIGQVYKTRLASGEEVVVKVRKPGIEEIIESDLKILKKLATLLDGKLARYGIESATKVVDEFARTITKELSFTLEAQNLRRFTAIYENDPRVRVPQYFEMYSSDRVLVLEYIEGIKVSDTDKLQEAAIDAKEVAKLGFNLMCDQIFRHRFFHADPHPGNIFVLDSGTIAFIDFGMMGKITHKEQKEFTQLIYYIVTNEEEKAAEMLLAMAKKPETIDMVSFSKDLDDLISTYFYSDLKDIKIKNIFDDTTNLMTKYKVYFKEEYYLLFKALMIIEGVGKNLDPSFNASEQIKPIILDIVHQEISLKNLIPRIKEAPKELALMLSDLPEKSKKLLNLMTAGKFKIEFEHMGLEALELSTEKSFNRLSIAIIIAAILVGSSIVLYAKIPPLYYGIPLFGLGGFIVALLMSFVLIYSIIKQGRL